jgi:hypothetical protein
VLLSLREQGWLPANMPGSGASKDDEQGGKPKIELRFVLPKEATHTCPTFEFIPCSSP